VGLRLSANIVAFAAALGAAAPARAASINAQVKAKVVKPLTLTSIQNLDLGTITLGPGTWSGAIVRLARTGALTCPANVTCSGLTQVARYSVAGSNNETVVINAPNVNLVNQSDSTKTLTMTVDKPATVKLTNSSPRGATFDLGGAITVNSTTPGGSYVGTFNVTVDYQ
jgi:hypothetical protein